MPLHYTNPNDWGRSSLTDNALRMQQIKTENPEQWAAMNEKEIQAFFMPSNTHTVSLNDESIEELTRVQKLCILKLLCINLINSEASLIGFSLADRESYQIIDLLAEINQNLPKDEYLALAEVIINQLKNSPNKQTSEMSKYYLCEADKADEGINKVTPYDDGETALVAANLSIAGVHFISTVNPLADGEIE